MANEGRIEHRAAKVSLVTGLSTILSIVFQLISVPVCLKYWGDETYGRWLALFSAFLLLRSLDTGYTVYVGNKLNYLYHQDTDALRKHLASAVVGIAVISAVQLVLSAGALAIDPLAAVMGMSASDTNALTGKLGLLVLVISWVLTGSYLGIVHRLLIPAGLMYQAAWWAMGFQVTQFGAIMAAAVLRLSMLHTSILFAFSQLFIYVASAFYVRRALPNFSPWLHGIQVSTGLRDLAQSMMLTASNLIQQGSTNGLVLLVAAMAGPVAVPVFTTVRTLTNLWTSVTTVLTAPLLPEVVRMHVKGEAFKLVVMNQAYWALVGSAVSLGALLSYPLVPIWYAQWTRHAMPLDTGLLCLMLGSVVVTNAGALIALHLNGINSLRIVLTASVARAAFALGIGTLGYSKYGLAGFGMGILLGELVATVLTVRHFVRHEVKSKGAHMSPAMFGPIGLSVSSALTFFVGTGLGWWSGIEAWIAALIGVGIAAAWGWNGLDRSLRLRLFESFVPSLRR